MAIRSVVDERTPLDNVEVEYVRSGAARRDHRPGFNRVRLLDIGKDEAEIAARETLPVGEKVQLTFHVKAVRDFLKVAGTVKKSSRITVLKQPAFGIQLAFENLSEDDLKKALWARDQLVPKRAKGPIRRAEEAKPTEEKEQAPAAPSGAAETAPKTAAAAQGGDVQRPVALLELIDNLDKLHVTEDLIMAVAEAAEAGMDVEVLYPVSRKDAAAAVEEAEQASGEPMPADGQARPMNVYRLAPNTRLHFSAAGAPVGPPVGLFYLSGIQSPETCFAVRLETDAMAHSGSPTFGLGSILVFSTKEKVRNGQFAFVKSRLGDRFVQVFLDKPEEVRLRPLNAQYPEHVLRRSEVKVMCRLIGSYQPSDAGG